MDDLNDMLADELLAAIGYFSQQQHPTEGAIRNMAVPTEWSATPPTSRRSAPNLGSMAPRSCANFGYAEHDIAAIVDERVLGR